MRELYIDISNEDAGGSLYRVTNEGKTHFYYNHSTYNSDTDELKVLKPITLILPALGLYHQR